MVVGLLAFAQIGLHSTLAQGADRRTRAKAHFEAGAALYRADQFNEAIREFKAGYALVPRSGFLINLGQAYRKLGQDGEARYWFQRYLDETPQGPQRAQVAELIAKIPADAPRRASSVTSTATAPSSSREAETALASAQVQSPAQSPALDFAQRSSAPADPRRPRRVAGYSLLGVSALFAIVGGALIGVAHGENAKLENPAQGWVYDPSLESRRDTYNGVGIGLATTSAVSVVLGAVFAITGRRAPVEVAFDTSRSNGTVRIGGRF